MVKVNGGSLKGQLDSDHFGAVSVKGGNFKGSMTAAASAEELGRVAALKSITVTGGILAGDIRLFGTLGKVQVSATRTGPGGHIDGATITASKIAALIVSKDVVDSTILAGADLGSDHALGGDNDTFRAGSIAAVTVKGNVANSVIAAGLSTTDTVLNDDDDTIISGIASIIGKFSIGSADAQSYFAAGKFKTAPKITKVKIDPLSDPRFLTLP